MQAAGHPIAATATAPGRGAIGIIRISGTDLDAIALPLLGDYPAPRQASIRTLRAADGEMLDEALVLYFAGPHSYTGQDMLEIHCHGNPVLLDAVLERICQLGAQLAEPGEFSQRAFLNGKMDLTQAEAVADLIDASSRASARGAIRSLKGEFSQQVQALAEQLNTLRVQVEGQLDFPAEELDTADLGRLVADTEAFLAALDPLLDRSGASLVLGEGLEVALVGHPNTGKSSLFNVLAGRNLAIVSGRPGTTRDAVHCRLTLKGAALELTDTAGLRQDSDDEIEGQGMDRTRNRVSEVDLILLISDVENPIPPIWTSGGPKALRCCRSSTRWICGPPTGRHPRAPYRCQHALVPGWMN